MIKHSRIGVAVLAEPGATVEGVAQDALLTRDIAPGEFMPRVVMIHNDTPVEVHDNDTVASLCARWEAKRERR